jgi:hypothetical protein
MKRTTVRPEDALTFLKRALAHPPKSKERQAHLEAALLTYYFGMGNQGGWPMEDGSRTTPSRGDRRGGNRDPFDDAAALAQMRGLSKKTGERRKRVLARMVVENGAVNLKGAQPESVIARLAAKYPGAK